MRKGKGSGGGRHGLVPNSLKIISSCLKTVSSNASSVASSVRSVGGSVASSVTLAAQDHKDQVLWAGFDKLEVCPSAFKHVLLLGYSNGFQVIDVDDASDVRELVSKRDGPVTFLQMQPIPAKSDGPEGFRASHPLLVVVAGDEINSSGLVQGGHNGPIRDNPIEPQPGNCVSTPTVVRFYSLRSHSYVHVLRFRSSVYIIRCSPRIVAVALASQIYCFDAVTFENKFSVLTYPMPHGGQGVVGVNIGYGPMAVGPRWLAYASNNPLLSNSGHLSPQNLTPSPGVSPSTSPGNGSLVARYAVESSKHLATGIINLGDMGYKTLSKYYQDLLPDGSNSPISSNSSWKVGRLTSASHPTETDNAGMVVVKDFVSKAVISQFRAHTSPISALCFDPSGTLLVTASVCGNNINVFRIMPSSVPNGSSSVRYDWSSSHVHLYKLYRGLTTAVIQDICFSHYSQWIAIVSSRGTCHIFVLSPFGGDAGLQTHVSHSDGPVLLPSLSLPWWSTPSHMINQQSFPPPSPVTLSVVSRIKNSNCGWLNSVSNAAASATGKVSVPSGAVAAAFHNSVFRNLQPFHSKPHSLEHLLAYSPSGHVIQHELLPSNGESSDCSSRTATGPLVLNQDEELRVNVEPVQWWDVCRRSNWPEREEFISSITFGKQETAEVVMDTLDCEYNDTKYMASFNNSIEGKDDVKSNDRHHWFLSNAEVQISSGRIPIWQKSKICFYMMDSSSANERMFSRYYAGGEIEIEKIPVQEVEIRRKDLLPVFEHFHSIQSGWNVSGFSGGRYPISSSLEEAHRIKYKFVEQTVIKHTKSESVASGESSDVGSSRTSDNSLDLDQASTAKPFESFGMQPMEKPIPHGSILSSSLMDHCVNKMDDEPRANSMSALPQSNTSARTLSQSSSERDCVPCSSKDPNKGHSIMDSCVTNGLSSSENHLPCVGMPAIKGALYSNNSVSCEPSNAYSSNNSVHNIHVEENGHLHNPVEFGQIFREGYCKISELSDCHDLTEVVTDAESSSSHCEREKTEDDGDNDDMLGGVFAFSEG